MKLSNISKEANKVKKIIQKNEINQDRKHWDEVTDPKKLLQMKVECHFRIKTKLQASKEQISSTEDCVRSTEEFRKEKVLMGKK